jgi:spermidine synthase
LLKLLALSVGLPFCIVAASGPMLQRWFGASGHPRAHDPYFLYAASNLGSMLGLLAYPVLLEPSATFRAQSRLWSVGYLVLAALTLACAAAVRRAGPQLQEESAGLVPEPIAPLRRLRWIALAFVPSSLMLGVTTHLSTDIAPVPLLWVIPLTLYLLTFVLAFSRRGVRGARFGPRLLPFALLPLLVLMGTHASNPFWLVVTAHLVTFFLAALTCHTALAQDRPEASRLTEFFFWVSLGGVLGGAFNAVVAPVIFNSIAEYPLALVMVAVLRRPIRERRGRPLIDIAAPVALAVALWLLIHRSLPGADRTQLTILFGIPALVVFSFTDRRLRFALGVAALLVGVSARGPIDGRLLLTERTFFGVVRVVDTGDRTVIAHGTTVHGTQIDGSTEPLAYYHRRGPLGDVFSSLPRPPARVAVVGLGSAAMSCLGSSVGQWTYYEIDPVVERIARDPDLFTYLRECSPDARVVIGDARLSLEREPPTPYDVIVVDAFNSDAVPVHLLTREAMDLYRSRLAPGGTIVFHISNRYLDLAPVMRGLARDANLVALIGDTDPSAGGLDGLFASRWVAMAKTEADLGGITRRSNWRGIAGRETLWTDDYSNVLDLFSWR